MRVLHSRYPVPRECIQVRPPRRRVRPLRQGRDALGSLPARHEAQHFGGGGRPQVITKASPESFIDRVRRRAGWAVRDRFPNRRVVREVQGVTLTLPWAHRLPDYAREGSPYGQNLVELASLLKTEAPLTVLDVGANVGDSALQILNATDARVLCVEADTFYLEFLQLNVGDDPRVSIEPSLLDSRQDGVSLSPVRSGGTTRFVPGDSPHARPSVSPAELRSRFPAFERLRLVKSDTDGYDVELVPAIASVWSDVAPVLFFEYDPGLSRIAGNDPQAVWGRLKALGYETAAVWNNGGEPLGRCSLADIGAASRSLESGRRRLRAAAYWDVAVVHRDDAAALDVIAKLVPEHLTP